MTEYMLSVFAVTAALGLCSLALYKDSFEGVSKFAFSVILISTVILPLSKLTAQSPPDFSLKPPELPDGVPEYERVAVEAFSDGISAALKSEYSLKEEEILVSVSGFEFESMRAELIKVTLRGGGILLDRKKVENYVESLGVGKCEVEIEIG